MRGLGTVEVFDPKRVVAFPELQASAVHGWDRRNAFTYTLLTSLAAHYHLILTHRSNRAKRRNNACCMGRVTKTSPSVFE